MKLITVDFETYYGPEYTLSLKDMTTEKYILDNRFKCHGAGIKVNNNETRWVSAKYLPEVFKALDFPNNAMVGHNLQFDGAILAWRYGIYPKLYIDTLGLSRCLVGPASKRHGLKYIGPLVTGKEKTDDLVKTYGIETLPPELESILGKYCINDVEVTYAILQRLLPLFPEQELAMLDWTIRAFTDPKLILDKSLLSNYIEELEIEKEAALVNAGLDSREMLMSNEKYAAALESLGVRVPVKVNAKGQIKPALAKTDAEHIALLDHPNPAVQAIVAARLAHKSTTALTRARSYLEAAQLGPWPVAYNYSGATSTHRLSGNRGGGGNPQNIPRKSPIRDAITAPDGYVIGVADYSQIECRGTLYMGTLILGPDSEEAKALKVMAEGGDIYSYFGGKFYGIEIHKDTHPKERQIAKSAVLGLGYGMGPGRFMDYCIQSGIDVDTRMAEELVVLYRTMFKGVKKFWWQCQRAVAKMTDGEYGASLPFDSYTNIITCKEPLFGYPAIKSPTGLYIKYPDLRRTPENELVYGVNGEETKLFGGKITQNIMELVTSEIMRKGLITVNKVFPVVMTTHDEIVCLVPEDKQHLFGPVVENVMCRPVPYFPNLPIAVEWGIHKRYGHAK